MEAGPSEFVCTHPGCTKGFTRKDHLIRHSANHSVPNFHCSTCHRPFKRLDLLQRHEKRGICGDEVYPKRRRTSSSLDDRDLSPSTTPNHVHTQTITQADVMLPTPSEPLPAGDLMPDFVISDNPDWGFGLWPPDPWEALLHDTLAPPFNEPALTVDTLWSGGGSGLTPRMQESAERGGSAVSQGLVNRLQMAFPDLEITLTHLTESLHHYWAEISPTFPFIHRGTFDLLISPPELVTMMFIVGSTHLASRPLLSHRKIVQRIRGVLVQDCGLEMPISTLQAFCLCHVHDTWYSTSESQFVAQCMWPVMVAHSRKKGIGVVGRPENEAQEEEAWAVWAKDEERRRAAFCVLLIDTQLSAFWNQHPSRQLSIFAHNINLPGPKNQWEATTAADWFRVREPPSPSASIAKKPRSGYLPGLHPEFQVNVVSEGYSSSILSALAAEQRLPFRVDIENSLGVEMILIGLMAIAWDCRTRGGMGIRFREGTKHWRSIVLNAVINLRAAWEMGVNHLQPSVEIRDMRDTFAISVISVLSDIPMLQVAAGATSICGASIGPRQYADAKRRLRLWSKTEDAWTCLWQSARYLRQSLWADWGVYSTWAVFLTTLVCWAYAWASSKDDRLLPASENPSHLCIILLDTILASPARLDSLDVGVSDLIACTAERLSGGEEIERDNAGLMWRLIGAGRRRSSFERPVTGRQRFSIS